MEIPGTELEPPSVPLVTSVQTQEEVSYLYSNACNLEIYCSPFGVSALYINITDSGIVGIGSTMGRITGLTRGKVFYNNGELFKQKKFKIHGVVNPDGDLRIDFFKIDFFKSLSEDANGSIVDSNPTDHPEAHDGDSLGQPVETVFPEVQKDEILEVPDIIFLGKCPDCRPSRVDPFIGVFSFEGTE